MPRDDEGREPGEAGYDEREAHERESKPGAAGEAPKDKKADKRKTTIIVALTFVGVIIAWLSFRKSGSAAQQQSGAAGTSSATNPAYYPTAGSGSVTGAGYGGGTDQSTADAINGLAVNINDLTSGLQSFESGLQSQLGTTTTTGTGVTSGSSGTTAGAHSLTYTAAAGDTFSSLVSGLAGGAGVPAGMGGVYINELKSANPGIGANTPLAAGQVINTPTYYTPPKPAAKK